MPAAWKIILFIIGAGLGAYLLTGGLYQLAQDVTCLVAALRHRPPEGPEP